MDMPLVTPNVPMGLAFEIADLMLLQGWAEFHNVHMVVELDHCVEGEEYEEVVAFYARRQPAAEMDPLARVERHRRSAADRPKLPIRHGGGRAGEPQPGAVIALSSGMTR